MSPFDEISYKRPICKYFVTLRNKTGHTLWSTNSWSTTHITTLVSNVNVPAHVTVNSIIKKMSTSCCIHQQLMLHQVVGFWVWHVVLHLLKMAQTASSVVSSIFADIEKYICGQWFHQFKLLSLYNLAKYLILLIIFSTTESVVSK